MTRHVEILQTRQRRGNAPAENPRRGKPAFVAALPVPRIAHEGRRRRNVGKLNVSRQARKPALEMGDHIPDNGSLVRPVALGILLLEPDPVFGPASAAGP